MFDNKTILITGGTGSFGETLAYKFLKTDIGQIRILVEMKKNKMISELNCQIIRLSFI